MNKFKVGDKVEYEIFGGYVDTGRVLSNNLNGDYSKVLLAWDDSSIPPAYVSVEQIKLIDEKESNMDILDKVLDRLTEAAKKTDFDSILRAANESLLDGMDKVEEVVADVAEGLRRFQEQGDEPKPPTTTNNSPETNEVTLRVSYVGGVGAGVGGNVKVYDSEYNELTVVEVAPVKWTTEEVR